MRWFLYFVLLSGKHKGAGPGGTGMEPFFFRKRKITQVSILLSKNVTFVQTLLIEIKNITLFQNMQLICCRLTKIFNRGRIDPNDHCSIQDNCIDNVCFFGTGKFPGTKDSDDLCPVIPVRHLRLSTSLSEGDQLYLWCFLELNCKKHFYRKCNQLPELFLKSV